MNATEIYAAIDNKSVSKGAAIKMIENYGMQKSIEGATDIAKKMGCDTPDEDVLEVIDRLNNRLDELLKNVVGCYTAKRGKK